MVQRGEYNGMAYLATVADCYTAVILKMTAGIYEHIPADGYIFAEIGIERGKQPERGIHLPAEQTRYKCANLIGRMICRVEFKRNPPRLLAHFVHKGANIGSIQHLPPFDKIEKIQKFHIPDQILLKSHKNQPAAQPVRSRTGTHVHSKITQITASAADSQKKTDKGRKRRKPSPPPFHIIASPHRHLPQTEGRQPVLFFLIVNRYMIVFIVPIAGRKIFGRNRRVVEPGDYRENTPASRIIEAQHMLQRSIVADIKRGQVIIVAPQLPQRRIMADIKRGQAIIVAEQVVQRRIGADIKCRQIITAAVQLRQRRTAADT